MNSQQIEQLAIKALENVDDVKYETLKSLYIEGFNKALSLCEIDSCDIPYDED